MKNDDIVSDEDTNDDLIKNNQIDLVIRTGGSSLIPAVNNILNEHFSGKVIDHDPFTSVAAGLAISDYYGFEFTG